MEANIPSAKQSQQPEQLSIIICGLVYQTQINVSGKIAELPEYPNNTIRTVLPEDADDEAMTSTVWANERALLNPGDPLALDFDFALLFPDIQNFRNQRQAFHTLQTIYQTPSPGPLALRCAAASAAFIAINDNFGAAFLEDNNAHLTFSSPSEKRISDLIVDHRDSKKPRIDGFVSRDRLEKADDGDSPDYNHPPKTGGLIIAFDATGDFNPLLNTNEPPYIPISHQSGLDHGSDFTFASSVDSKQKQYSKQNVGASDSGSSKILLAKSVILMTTPENQNGAEDQRGLEKQESSGGGLHRSTETYIERINKDLAPISINTIPSTTKTVARKTSNSVINSQEGGSEYKPHQTETPSIEQSSENSQNPGNEEEQHYGPSPTHEILRSKYTKDGCLSQGHGLNFSEINTLQPTCSAFESAPGQISLSLETVSDMPQICNNENLLAIKTTGHPNSQNAVHVDIPYIQQENVHSGNEKEAEVQNASGTKFQYSSRLENSSSLEIVSKAGLPQKPPQKPKGTVGSLSFPGMPSNLPPRPIVPSKFTNSS